MHIKGGKNSAKKRVGAHMKTSKFIIKLLICLICVTQTVAIAQDRNSTFKPE